MPWLVHDGKVLATLEVRTSLRGRARGLLGCDGLDGAILLRPARAVHTLRMRFAIDVAFCDDDLRVLKVVTLVPNRVSRPVLRSHAVVECEAGMFAKWGVGPGDKLEVRGGDDLDPRVPVRVRAARVVRRVARVRARVRSRARARRRRVA
jgi:uncharacterized membrane protein (UPF0127 family)